jgi:hypothetical protein
MATDPTPKQAFTQGQSGKEVDWKRFMGVGSDNHEKTVFPLTQKSVLGLPFHLRADADPAGRMFKRNMLENPPIVSISIGRPNFRKLNKIEKEYKIDKEEVNQILSSLDEIDEAEGSKMAEIMARSATLDTADPRFYTFEEDYAGWMRYVNAMLATVAAKFKESPNFHPAKRHAFVWSDNYSSSPDKLTSVLQLWLTKASSYTDSGSNDFGETAMAQFQKTMSGMAKELHGMLGTGSQYSMNTNADQSRVSKSVGASQDEIVSAVSGGNSIVGTVGQGISSIANGANMTFPEIWKDSSWSRSCSLTCDFRSPYGDPASIFDHVIMPALALAALALPRQDSLTGYIGPFLVRVDSPGWFNIDLGAVTSVSIKKAPDNEWSKDDLPMRIEVTLDIKDLFPTMYASREFKMIRLNKGLHTYLDNMAGWSTLSPYQNFRNEVFTRIAAFTSNANPRTWISRGRYAASDTITRTFRSTIGGN